MKRVGGICMIPLGTEFAFGEQVSKKKGAE